MQPESKGRQPPTVLVVDDEAQMRAIERRVLEGLGYSVLEAAGGTDLIDLLAGGARFDLLIADLDMPMVRGDEMVKRLRRSRPDLRVLYVTGHADWLMGRTMAPGEGFLEKPFSAAELGDAVSRLLTAK